MVLLIKMKYRHRWYPSHTHPIPVWLIFNSNLSFVCVLCLPPLSHTFYLFLLCFYWQYFLQQILLRNEQIPLWKVSIDDAKINFSLSNKNNNLKDPFLISRKFLQKNLFKELSHAKDFLSLSLPLSFILIQVGQRVLSEERWNNSIRYNGNSSRMRLEAEMGGGY